MSTTTSTQQNGSSHATLDSGRLRQLGLPKKLVEMSVQYCAAKVVCFSACADAQKSAGVSNVNRLIPASFVAEGTDGGACTSLILQILYQHYKMEVAMAHRQPKQGKIRLPPLTYSQVLTHMFEVCERNGYTQLPQLSSSRPIRLDKDPFRIVPPRFHPRLNTKRALLVGINYTGTPFALSGCHNDCRNVKGFLKQVHDFEDTNITMMLDDGSNPDTQPTKANLLRTFRQFALSCREGDVVVFHFAGHGVSVEDESGDESDGFDEALMPCDYLTNGEIIDDDVFRLLLIPMPRNVAMTAIVDCCHSGTILDLPFDYRLTSNNTFDCDYDMVSFPHMHMVRDYEAKMESIKNDRDGLVQKSSNGHKKPGFEKHHPRNAGSRGRTSGRNGIQQKRKSRSLEPSSKLALVEDQYFVSGQDSKPIRKGTREKPVQAINNTINTKSARNRSKEGLKPTAAVPARSTEKQTYVQNLTPPASPPPRKAEKPEKHAPLATGLVAKTKKMPQHGPLSLSPHPRGKQTKAKPSTGEAKEKNNPLRPAKVPYQSNRLAKNMSPQSSPQPTRSTLASGPKKKTSPAKSPVQSPTQQAAIPDSKRSRRQSPVRASPVTISPRGFDSSLGKQNGISKLPFGSSHADRTDADPRRKEDWEMDPFPTSSARPRQTNLQTLLTPQAKRRTKNLDPSQSKEWHHPLRSYSGNAQKSNHQAATARNGTINRSKPDPKGRKATVETPLSPRSPRRTPNKKYGRHATVGLSSFSKPPPSPRVIQVVEQPSKKPAQSESARAATPTRISPRSKSTNRKTTKTKNHSPANKRHSLTHASSQTRKSNHRDDNAYESYPIASPPFVSSIDSTIHPTKPRGTRSLSPYKN